MIDDLNTQGHKKLLIREDGSVAIQGADTQRPAVRIPNFPARMEWEEFRHLLKEDEITAEVQPDGLLLAWR